VEVSTCFSDAMCTALMDCLGPCVDDACASTCFSKFPSTAYEALGTCARDKCGSVCGA
jgi:hypothetical protein